MPQLPPPQSKPGYGPGDYISIIHISRPIDGEFNLLLQDLREMDQELFFKYFRMNSQRFDQLLLLLLIKSKIYHNYTHQIPISSAERLEIKRCEY